MEGPRHGYSIVQEVRKQAGISLGPGTLYGALSRLEAYGLVASLAQEGRRRPYQLTDKGRQTLDLQLDAMAKFLRVNGHLEERGIYTPIAKVGDDR